MSRQDYIIVTADYARKCVEKVNAVSKTIRSSHDCNRNWEYFLDQLEDPQRNRPIKRLDKRYITCSLFRTVVSRARVYDAAQEIWVNRELSKYRGSAKETCYSKKMATTLLPADGVINLFRHSIGDSLGVLLNLDETLLKDKYVFETTINSDSKPWLAKTNDFREENDLVAIPIEELRQKLQQQRSSGVTPEANELLPKVKKEAVIGVFAASDDLVSRIGALAKQAAVYRSLNRIVPVFYFNEFGLQDYTLEQQQRDIQLVLAFPEGHPARVYYHQFCDDAKTLSQAGVHSVDVIERQGIGENNTQREADSDQYFESSKRTVAVEKIVEAVKKNGIVDLQGFIFTAGGSTIDISNIQRAIESDQYFENYKHVIKTEIIRLVTRNKFAELQELILTAVARHRYYTPLVKELCDHLPQQYFNSDFSAKLQLQMMRYMTSADYACFQKCYNLYGNSLQLDLSVYTNERLRAGADYYYAMMLAQRAKPISGFTFSFMFNPDLYNLSELSSSTIKACLAELHYLGKISKKYAENYYYQWRVKGGSSRLSEDTLYGEEQFNSLYLRLLLALEYNNSDYVYTSADKRLLEKHYLEKVADTKSQNDLDGLKKVFCESNSFNYHRNSHYDKVMHTVFGRDSRTTIMRHVMTAIDKRSTEIQVSEVGELCQL